MPAASRKPKPGRVRKNIELDQQKLTELKAHFGAKTETEALDRAMNQILFAERVSRGLERLRAAGGIDEVFPDGALARMRAEQAQREREQQQKEQQRLRRSQRQKQHAGR